MGGSLARVGERVQLGYDWPIVIRRGCLDGERIDIPDCRYYSWRVLWPLHLEEVWVAARLVQERESHIGTFRDGSGCCEFGGAMGGWCSDGGFS